MTYKKVYNKLLKYKKQELISGSYIDDNGCRCVLGVVLPVTTKLGSMDLIDEIEEVLDKYDINADLLRSKMTLNEARELQHINDEDPALDNKTRYWKVVSYLKSKIDESE